MLLENYYYYFQSAIPIRICNEIIDYGKQHTSIPALTHVDDPKTGDVKFDVKDMTEKEKNKVFSKRNSNIAWFNDEWIYKEVYPYIHEANERAGLNLQWDYTEDSQFTIYNEGQFYGWHADGHPRPYKDNHRFENYRGKIRKLSVTVQLNDPSEFEGGNLEFSFRNGKDFDENPEKHIHTCTQIRPQGSIVVFPSFVWHRVTPVTKGTRYSLVMWNLGWPFR